VLLVGRVAVLSLGQSDRDSAASSGAGLRLERQPHDVDARRDRRCRRPVCSGACSSLCAAKGKGKKAAAAEWQWHSSWWWPPPLPFLVGSCGCQRCCAVGRVVRAARDCVRPSQVAGRLRLDRQPHAVPARSALLPAEVEDVDVLSVTSASIDSLTRSPRATHFYLPRSKTSTSCR
jgi:hypothetical protein